MKNFLTRQRRTCALHLSQLLLATDAGQMGDLDLHPSGFPLPQSRNERPNREKIMKYLCCVYLTPDAYKGLSADEMAKLNRDSLAYNDELAKKGHYIAASALQPPQTAKTIRRRTGKTVMTDGPYAETKEVLGGFILIECETWRRRSVSPKIFPSAIMPASKSAPK